MTTVINVKTIKLCLKVAKIKA